MKTLTKLQLHITHKITNILLLRYSNDALSGNLWQNTKYGTQELATTRDTNLFMTPPTIWIAAKLMTA
jgi:hypothetical protein